MKRREKEEFIAELLITKSARRRKELNSIRVIHDSRLEEANGRNVRLCLLSSLSADDSFPTPTRDEKSNEKQITRATQHCDAANKRSFAFANDISSE